MATLSEKLVFPGHGGNMLAARLDRPVGPARAQAIFAHCFTCSKDIQAARVIAQALAAQGIAVLRFDFTGLGHSGGEFANTNFSSNIADLVAAADWLRMRGEAPQLLIGHSLGGAAVLAAAGAIPEIRAIVTIAAPADAAHVTRSFAADLPAIAETGAAQVTLGGRRFTIAKQFLDDLAGNRLEAQIAALNRPLLIFHAPRDSQVGIDNAERIFRAAKHPKSFVSLDEADHLLTRPEDAAFVAAVTAAWAARYLPKPVALPASNLVQLAETGLAPLQQRAEVRGQAMLVDEPADLGGSGSGPTPYDYLSVALAACTSMTLRMYADRKGLALGRIGVSVDHARIHAQDCRDCGEGRAGRIDRFERVIRVEGAVDTATQARLLEIADKCPVHRTLEGSAAVVTRFEPGDPDAGGAAAADHAIAAENNAGEVR